MKPIKSQIACAALLETLEGRTLLSSPSEVISSAVETPQRDDALQCLPPPHGGPHAPCFGIGPSGTISGRVFEDKNGNGVMDEGENPVYGVAVSLKGDDWEKIFFHSLGSKPADPVTGKAAIFYGVEKGTGADGLYNFQYFYPGEMTLKVQSTDRTFIETRIIPLNITDFENHTIDIGVKIVPPPPVVPPVYKVKGTAFIDSNRNGVFDAGESALQGAGVFIDKNRNGKRDGGEQLVRTNAAGRFSMMTSTRQFRLKFLVPQRYAKQGIFNYEQEIDASSTTGPIQLLIGLKPRRATFGFILRFGLDAREPLLENVGVVVDRNDNGVKDLDERIYLTDSSRKFAAFVPYGVTRLKLTVPGRYQRQGLFSRDYMIRVFNSKDGAHLLIGLPATSGRLCE